MAASRKPQAASRKPQAMWLRLGRWLRHPYRLVLLLALALTLIAFFANEGRGDLKAPRGDGTYRPFIARGDGHMMFLMTRSLVLDGDIRWANDLARFGDPWKQPITATGRKMIPHPIGPSLVWTPFFVAGHASSKVANGFGAEIADHGYTLFHQRFVFVTSPIFAWFAIILGLMAARRWISAGYAPLYAAVAALFGTSLTYYIAASPAYAHAMDALACGSFLTAWALTFGDRRWLRYVVLGALLGVCALIRITGFALAVVLVVEALFQLAETRQWKAGLRLVPQLAARGLVAASVAFIVFVPQLLAWKITFGEFMVSPMGPNFVDLTRPEWIEMLFSSRNGWLSSHPIAYAGLIGLLFVPKPARPIALGFFAATAIQVWVNASVFDWWSGASFGQRRMCSMTIVVVFGLAALIHVCNQKLARVPRAVRHGLAIFVLGWFVVWNVALIDGLRDKSAGSRTRKMCCRHVPDWMEAIANPLYSQIGNPWAFPASAIYSLGHDVPLRTWDKVVGNYADFPELKDWNEGTHWKRSHVWNIGKNSHSQYVVSGLGSSRREPHGNARWMTEKRAVFLLPLFVEGTRELTFDLHVAQRSGAVALSFAANDRLLATRQLGPGKHRITLTADDLKRGTNQISLETESASKDEPTVALQKLTLRYPGPP